MSEQAMHLGGRRQLQTEDSKCSFNGTAPCLGSSRNNQEVIVPDVHDGHCSRGGELEEMRSWK